MWDSFDTILDVLDILDLLAHWRVAACVVLGLLAGFLAHEIAPRMTSGEAIVIASGLVGLAVGILWDWTAS